MATIRLAISSMLCACWTSTPAPSTTIRHTGSAITFADTTSATFRLFALTITLDGKPLFTRDDEHLAHAAPFVVFDGTLDPGVHVLAIAATFRGHGEGVFSYLSSYTFDAKTRFELEDTGLAHAVACRAIENGGAGVPIERRLAIECSDRRP
jgi:hypothetical protein